MNGDGGITWARTKAALICLTACLTVGCYESPFPLDPAPQADIDARLPGKWHCVTSDDGDRDLTLTITRARDRVYSVTFQEFGQELERYEAHASVVAGATIVNLRNIKPSPKPWAYVQYTLFSARVLHLQVVNDKAMKGVAESTAAVRWAIERQIKDPALFVEACACLRMNEK